MAAARDRRGAVRAALDGVTDPELDRSLVDLGYVDEVAVDGGRATVRLTLPTAWCSPAFAWMMATDAREAVEALPGVERAGVYVRNHVHEVELNRGVNAGRSFEEAFPDADGGVADVRARLDEKARTARQYAAVEAVLDAGLDPEQVVDLRVGDVEFPAGEVAVLRPPDLGFAVTVPADPLEAYLEKARATGVGSGPADPLFRTPEGDPVDADEFDLVHRRGRLARVNMSGQGGLCEGLRDAREKRTSADADADD